MQGNHFDPIMDSSFNILLIFLISIVFIVIISSVSDNLTIRNIDVVGQISVQKNVKIEIVSEDSCKNLLQTGRWGNFTYQKPSEKDLLPEEHQTNVEFTKSNAPLFSRNGTWAFSGQFKPDSCNIFQYDKNTLQTCLRNNYSKNYKPTNKNSNSKFPIRPIFIIGDSRGRLIFRALAALSKGQRDLTDQKIHNDFSIDYFNFYWSEGFTRVKIPNDTKNNKIIEPGFPKMLHDLKENCPQMIVIYEQILHTVVDTLKVNMNYSSATVPKYNLVKPLIETGLKTLENDILPKIFDYFDDGENLTKCTSNLDNYKVTVLVGSTEDALKFYQPENMFGNDFGTNEWKKIQRYYNMRLVEVIGQFKSNQRLKLQLMTNNQKTAYSPDRKISLLPDGSHKQSGIYGKKYKGEKPASKIPDSLYFDAQMIYNFHCNAVMNKRDFCCS